MWHNLFTPVHNAVQNLIWGRAASAGGTHPPDPDGAASSSRVYHGAALSDLDVPARHQPCGGGSGRNHQLPPALSGAGTLRGMHSPSRL